MNPRTQRFTLPGAAGPIELARDEPDGPARGLALIAHPHPLFGGTLDNKVVQTLARAFVQCGWSAVRFNFRGVGGSAGTHDGGRAETDDMLRLLAGLAPADDTALALAGFSFGSFVAASVAARLTPAQTARLHKLVLVGTAASRFEVPALDVALHARTLVVHGEHDDTVPLSAVMDWARPQVLPVTVVPAGGHFFHGQLPLLKDLVVRHLSA